MTKKVASPNPNSDLKPTVSVVGARGYSGVELTKILLKHPGVKLTACFATQDFTLNDELFSGAVEVPCYAQNYLMDKLTDYVFLATPAEVSLRLAPTIIAAGKKVIDLSGAYRLKKNDYKTWYHAEHTDTLNLQSSEYGLVPFADPVKKTTSLIANPGCYATSISMALIPLLKRNLISSRNLVVDAKSGTSGAGKKAAENLLFSEVSENCLPYRVGQHQHLPEIQETIENFSGVSIDPHFSTHLLPVKSGLISSIYAESKTTDISEIETAYAEEFAGYPLVRFGGKISSLARLDRLVGTPYTHISYQLIGNKLYLFSAIDNLQKGAASQAVENLNRWMDLPPQFSLDGEN